jgi:vacuolar-type H+-ATPase subunit I/STV1
MDVKTDIRHYHDRSDKEMVDSLVQTREEIKDELEDVEGEIEMLQQQESKKFNIKEWQDKYKND